MAREEIFVALDTLISDQVSLCGRILWFQARFRIHCLTERRQLTVLYDSNIDYKEELLINTLQHSPVRSTRSYYQYTFQDPLISTKDKLENTHDGQEL